MNATEVLRAVARALTDGLRRSKYRGDPCPLRGHCYVASEAAYHMLGGAASGYKPMNVRHEGDQHWFLRGPAGEVLDITAEQFSSPVPYDVARGRGFLTREPSQRAQEVIRRVKKESMRSSSVQLDTP